MLKTCWPWIGIILLLTACRSPLPSSPVPQKIQEVTGSKATRIATVTRRLQAPLPSPLQDAYHWQKQLGDGELGPRDFVEFGLLVVSLADLSQWQQGLMPLDKPPRYLAPQPITPWWPSEAHFLP